MIGPPVKLVIKQDMDITPTCHVKPYKVPLHWKKQVEKVPANTPATDIFFSGIDRSTPEIGIQSDQDFQDDLIDVGATDRLI